MISFAIGTYSWLVLGFFAFRMMVRAGAFEAFDAKGTSFMCVSECLAAAALDRSRCGVVGFHFGR